MPPELASSCPLCSTSVAESIALQGRRFYHCRTCDLIHVPSADHMTPQAERDRYLCHRNDRSDPDYVATFDGVLSLLTSRASGAHRVLDFGAGPVPVLCELLCERGLDAVGFDPHFAADADITGPFDAIVSVETFEHLRNPAAELKKLRTLLAPSAPLIIKTQFHAGLNALADWYYIRDKTHIVFYSPATFAWIAREFDLSLAHHDDQSLACLVASGSPYNPN